MTGAEWDRQQHSYELEKKRWRRMADGKYKEKEKVRLAKRDEARLPQLQAKREEAAEQQRKDEELNARDNLFLHLLEGRSSIIKEPLKEYFSLKLSKLAKYSWLKHSDVHEFLEEWRIRYLESATFLDLLYRDDEPSDEFVYHM